MKHRKAISLILAVILTVFLCAPALAEEAYPRLSGKIGDNAYYSYDVDTGVVTISGTGGTYDYEMLGVASFCPYSPLDFIEDEIYKIKALVVEDGITELNNWLMCDTSCKYIEIAASVEYISPLMLWNCDDIKAVFFYGDAPEGIAYSLLGKATFYHLPDAEGWDAVPGCEVKTFCGVPLTDVPGTAYYAQPVAWAYKNNIVGGYEDMSFQPMNVCTRAQVVTFIWRANGCPEPDGTAQGFTDVAEGTYYYKAVLWAAEKGITGGFDDGGFHPDETVTRAQAMTFLWRANGCPEVPEGTVNTFEDVPEDAYYHDAVLWAVANGITNGYNDTQFGPMDGCTRAQIVTFLYRLLAA